MTKVTTKYYVFRDKEKGEFLAKYQSRGTLAYRAKYTDDIQYALTMSVEGYEEQKKELKNLAKAFGAEIIEVNATYELTYPNGDEVREIKKDEPDEFKSLLTELFAKSIFGEGE